MPSRFLRTAIGMSAAVALLAACGSKLTEENFARVKENMSEQEVAAILGPPADSNSVQVLGVSGTSSRWKDSRASISIQFVNGKVLLKTYTAGPAK